MKMRKNENVSVKAYKFRIKPNEEQRIMFAKTFGCCRYLWNKMLADREEHYEKTGETLNLSPAAYKQKEESKWLAEVDGYALLNTHISLMSAYEGYFKGKKKKPNFKKKGVAKNSYKTNISHGNLDLNEEGLKLPKIKGRVKVIQHRPIKTGGQIKSVTISQEPNGNYYASILFEYPKEETPVIENLKAVGLDMSMKELYVSSDGELGNYPRYYRQLEVRIAKEQRKLSKMKKGSKNYEKQRKKVANLYAKAKHQRGDFLHKRSRSLVDRYDIISIENLNMSAMKRSLNLGKSASDNGWGMFTRMLDYKLAQKGGTLVKIDRWFPSSKTCSNCGCKNDDLALKDRVFVCPVCGYIADRDLQAAHNILNEGLRMLSAA